MILAVSRAQLQHSKKQTWDRCKLDISAVEELSQRAAFLLAAGNELATNTPVEMAIIQEQWICPWKEGSEQIDMELQAALLEQAEASTVHKWSLANMPGLKGLVCAVLQTHLCAALGHGIQSGTTPLWHGSMKPEACNVKLCSNI
jgi:hypothetical protein